MQKEKVSYTELPRIYNCVSVRWGEKVNFRVLIDNSSMRIQPFIYFMFSDTINFIQK